MNKVSDKPEYVKLDKKTKSFDIGNKKHTFSIEKINSLSILDLLVVMFIGLKLAGFIDWSWWWVFSPVWIPLLLIASVVIVMVVVTFIGGMLK